MSKYKVEIGNEHGQSFRISLVLPFNRLAIGSWRTNNKGFICHNSGPTESGKSDGTITGVHLTLFQSNRPLTYYGIRLNDFEDLWGVNDQGTGRIAQSWVLQFKWDVITWSLV